MRYILLILLFLGCGDIDFSITGNPSGSSSYVIDTEVQIKSNTNFPIASALVKMEWALGYNSSIRDSAYTNSNGEADIQTQIENIYSYQSQIPQIFFYISSSGFSKDTTIIEGNIFDDSMLDTLINRYIQTINHTIYLVPE